MQSHGNKHDETLKTVVVYRGNYNVTRINNNTI